MLEINVDGKYARQLRSRLYNWKFHQAVQYLEGQPPDVRRVVKALAHYGNPGMLNDLTDKEELAEAGMTKHEAVIIEALVDLVVK